MAKKLNPEAMMATMLAQPVQTGALGRLSRLAQADEAPVEAAPEPEPQGTPVALTAPVGQGRGAIRGVIDVPLDLLVEGAAQSRKFYPERLLEDMARSLREHGQLEAAKAWEKDGRYHLVEGHRRWRAAKLAGLATLKVDLCPPPESPLAAYSMSRTINRERASLTVLDDAFRLRELEESGAITRTDWMEVTGYDKTDVSRLLSITELPESVILALMESPALLTQRFLFAMAQYHRREGPAATARIVGEAVEKGMTARELEARIAKLDQAKTGRPRAHKVDLAHGAATGFMKSFPDGRLQVELKGLSVEEQASLMAQLQGMLTPAESA